MKQNYRDLFAYDSGLIYFNHAATGNLPKRAVAAMTAYIEARAKNGEPPLDDLLEKHAQFRSNAVQLFNADPNQISFTKNTSDGLAIALFSIDWQLGENMVVQEDAFPASLYQAHYCFPDVEKRYIPLGNGENFYDRVARLIDERTRAVVVDYVHFLSGRRMNLRKLWDITKKTNSYLIVDGIQGLGAVKIDLTETPVDFFAAGGIKWLQGPLGTGIFYVRKEIMKDLIPFHISWSSAVYEDFSSFYPIRPLHQDARRFQPLNENYVGLIGLTECLKMFNEIGSEKVEKIVLSLTTKAMVDLEKFGCEILTPGENSRRAGIVSFKHPNVESKKLHERLQENNVQCSLREGWIRFAIQFYNTEEEIDKAISVIQ